MEDKRLLLKQIGWSDELIDKCLSGRSFSDTRLSGVDYYVAYTIEHDTTNLTVDIDTPIMSDGSHLNQ